MRFEITIGIMDVLKNRLRLRRKQLGLSQEELAYRSNVTQGQISKYEQGVVPASDILSRISEELDTSVDWLIGRTDDVNAVPSEMELDQAERELLQLYRTKTREQQRKLLEIARLL